MIVVEADVIEVESNTKQQDELGAYLKPRNASGQVDRRPMGTSCPSEPPQTWAEGRAPVERR